MKIIKAGEKSRGALSSALNFEIQTDHDVSHKYSETLKVIAEKFVKADRELATKMLEDGYLDIDGEPTTSITKVWYGKYERGHQFDENLNELQMVAYNRALETDEDLFINGSGGVGKEQPLTSLVLTPDRGYIKMGDVKVGDKVCSPNGTTNTVLAIHPQGVKRVYTVRFTDGAVVECGKDHLWYVNSRNFKKNNGAAQVLSTEELMSRKLENKQESQTYRPFDVPLTNVSYTEKKLPIDPYLLGTLLGDGSMVSSNSVLLSYHKDDTEIIDRVSKLLPVGTVMGFNKETSTNGRQVSFRDNTDKQQKSSLRIAIEKLGLNIGSHEKFIPRVYLLGSRQQRLDLLRGLMDTDGSAGKSNRMRYSSTSMKLVDGIVELCKSLGGSAIIINGKVREKAVNHCYDVIIKFDDLNPFLLKRKAEKITPRRNNNIRKAIVEIKKTDVFVEQQCISLDGDHLYITDGFTTTHNTYVLVQIAQKLGFKCVIVAPTNAAVKNIEASLPEESGLVLSTIHKALRFQVQDVEDTPDGMSEALELGFVQRNENEMLADIVIIDEAGMVDGELIDSIKEKCKRVIFFGDLCQLEPVDGNQYDFEDVETIELTQQMRQEVLDTALYKSIQSFRTAIKGESKERGMIYYDDTLEEVESIAKAFIEKNGEIAVIGGYTNSVVNQTNMFIMEETLGRVDSAVGDKLLLYSPVLNDGFEVARNNGEMVTISNKFNDNYIGRCKYLFKNVTSEPRLLFTTAKECYLFWEEEMKNKGKKIGWRTFKKISVIARPTYCRTIHKLQGQTFNVVGVNANDIASKSFTNEMYNRLMYVALSRAKHKAYIMN